MATISLHSTHPCKHCLVSSICMAGKDKNNAEMAVRSHKVFNRKDMLVGAGQPFNGIYALRSGSAKSYVSINQGQEQITAFHYPGDILGIDGLGNTQYLRSIEFLETSSVCYFHPSEVKRQLEESAVTRDRLFKAMNKVIADEHGMLLCLSQYRSEQRLAGFLLDLSERFAARGLSPRQFDLSMTRTDIANYLGMAIETVSRLLTRFQKMGAIEVKNRQVTIVDFNLLQQMKDVDSLDAMPVYNEKQRLNA